LFDKEVIPDGILIDAIPEFAKQKLPRPVSEEGKVIDESDVHVSKQLSPSIVSPDGKLTLVREVHPARHPFAKAVIVDGILIDVSALH
jgi:hypothetical protein